MSGREHLGAVRVALLFVIAIAYLWGERTASGLRGDHVHVRSSATGWMSGALPVTHVLSLHGETQIADTPILDWQISGPLKLDGPMPAAPDAARNDPALRFPEFVDRPYRSPQPVVDVAKAFEVSRTSVVYARAELENDLDRDVAFVIGADDGISAWLDGRPVLQRPTGVGVATYPYTVPVHLSRGHHRLELAVQNRPPLSTWSFAAMVGPLAAARRSAREYRRAELLSHRVIPAGGRLEVNTGLFETNADVTVSITAPGGETLSQAHAAGGQVVTQDLAARPAGNYRLDATARSETVSETFLIGNPADQLRGFERRLAALDPDQPQRLDLDGLLFRWKYLLADAHRRPDDPFWEDKIVTLATELDAVITALEKRRSPFRSRAGRHLRAFRSRIDDSVQHYLIYVPESRRPGPLPLVVVVPFATEPNRPFLESVHVAEPHSAEIALAEKYGLAVVWPSARGNTHGSPIGVADILEVVAHAGTEYGVDPERVYLYGTCAGGREALLLAERYPSMFAAVGVLSPMTGRTTIEPSQPSAFFRRHSQSWLLANNPLSFAENLINVPVFIAHSEADKVPLDEAARFIARCRDAGFAPQFALLPSVSGPFASDTLLAAIFEFFDGRRRAPHPRSVRLSTYQLKYGQAHWVRILSREDPRRPARVNARQVSGTLVQVDVENVREYAVDPAGLDLSGGPSLSIATNGGPARSYSSAAPITVSVPGPGAAIEDAARKTPALEGPIAQAFAAPFLVIEPTLGPASARSQTQRWPIRFCALWKSENLGDCPVKKDFEVTEGDLQTRNLVLFGGPTENLILSRVADRLPVAFGPSQLRIGSKVYAGGVGFQFVCPNPLNRDRYLVAIGTHPARAAEWPAVNLPLEGWHDFAVWTEDPAGHFDLADIGSFDDSWRQPLSAMPASPFDGLVAALR